MADWGPAPRPFWGSIRWRASLLTSALVATVLVAFTWYVVQTVENDLLVAGHARAETTATILSRQTANSSQQGLTRFQDLAKDPAIRAFLASGDDAAKALAIDRLRAYSLRTPGQPESHDALELWDNEGGRLLLSVARASDAPMFPLPERPQSVGVGPLREKNGQLFTHIVEEVSTVANDPGRGRLGYIVISRLVQPTSPAAVNGIVGANAAIVIGNASGAPWTTLDRIVPAPPIDLTKTTAQEFIAPDGTRLIAAAALIDKTPWAVVIELPRDTVVAPAWALLRRLVAADVAILMVMTLVATLLSGRVVQPLVELTDAAETVARGDYTRRVPASGDDELGQLSQAFNQMAAHIEQSHRELATRNADLAESRTEAQRANRMKDQFLAVLSHELRTPLSAMLGWCRMLKDGVVPPDKRDHALAVIERNAVAQLRLVEDLLDVSRIVAGKFTVSLQPADPALVVHAAVESILPVASAKHVELLTTISRDAVRVEADPGRLQQAVWNLLSNAIRFTPAGGRVQVGVRRAGQDVEIEVKDSGDGIPSAALPGIFDRFRQLDSPNETRSQKSLGLGLAIVREVVELHHGMVEAESSGAGRGATFRIRLPLLTMAVDAPAEMRAPAIKDLAHPDKAPSIGGVRVLAVEDAADARELLEQFLANRGAVVTTVDGAEAAMATLDRDMPDVIISDIEMPGENGFDLMRRIRARHAAGAGIPAIALTAYGTPEDRARAYASGFDAHLVKPVDLGELVATISTLVTSATAGSQPRA